MPHLSRDEARAALWLFGSRTRAADRLGISTLSLDKLMRARYIPTAQQARLDSAWADLSGDQKRAIRNGADLIDSLSPRQRARLAPPGRGAPGRLSGQKFIKAVDQFKRTRPRLPRAVGDVIEETYERRRR